jgi:plasmid maintenance system antidote protein VapI
MKNEAEIRAELQAMVKPSTLREVAEKLDVSVGFLHDVIRGRRDVTDKVASKLGYRMEVTKTVDRQFFPTVTQNSAKSA